MRITNISKIQDLDIYQEIEECFFSVDFDFYDFINICTLFDYLKT